MAITTIPWGDGSSDNIYLDYPSASGNQTITVTSDANTGGARSKVVTFSASGVSPVSLTINQDAGIVPETFSANPSSSGGTSTVSNASRAYTDENSTTYANPRLSGVNKVNSWWFGFNTSSIPEGATIVSVECKAKARLTNTNNITPRTIGLYSGTTLKGNTQDLTASANVFTFSGATWTRNEVSDVRVTVNVTQTASASAPWMYFYGATLTIKYTI